MDDWARREDPPYSVWQKVSGWVARVASAPWQYPSQPIPELSDQPLYELRTAELADTGGVEVFYRREYDGKIVDLIWVGRPTDAGPT